MGNRLLVYLVDDDEDDRMFTREAFEDVFKEIDIIEFTDGEQLLDLLENEPQAAEPSLILLDINMPRVGGLQVLSSIRSKPSLCHIPIVLFSTGSNADTIKKAYQTGVNAYFVKPVSLSGYMKVAHASLCFVNRNGPLQVAEVQPWGNAKRILVIEDNQDHWYLMRLTLQSLGNAHLVHTDSAESAMDFLISNYTSPRSPVEMIILDLYLPARSNGLELIKSIRQFFTDQDMAPVPIIIFSASDDQDDIKASYQQLANAYITKSTDLASSTSYLKNVCSLWAATSEIPRMA